MKKKTIALALAFLAVFLIGIIGGRVFQHLTTGYHCRVLETKSFPFENGEVELSYTFESVGVPFLDPETSVLTLKTEDGLLITVYKAKRMFQESCPYIQDVSTELNKVVWNDGINTYRLEVKPVGPPDQKKETADPTPSADRLKALSEE
ncbi:MAG: hypothetical protein V1809_03980 [Planctomycetota bacterium]